MKKLGFLVLLTACGGAKAPPANLYSPLPAVDTGTNPSTGTESGGNGAPQIVVAPCDYWNSLAAPTAAGEQPFQLFESLAVQTTTGGLGVAASSTLVGNHNLAHVPYLRYGVSEEYGALDTSLCPKTADSLLDPPDIETFMSLASCEYKNNLIPWYEYDALQGIYIDYKLTGYSSLILSTRNTAVVQGIELQLPGVFTGTPGPLGTDKVLADLAPTMGTTPAALASATNLALLTPLAKPVKLFPSTDWMDRQTDLRQSMRILQRTGAQTNLSSADQVCRYAIAQRVTSQLLSLKGYAGTPQLLSSGLVPAMPTTDKTNLTKEDVTGTYNVVVTPDWVTKQLLAPTARPANAVDSESFIRSMRYFTEWNAYLVPSMWTTAPVAPAGTVQLNAQLAQLGVGLFGIGAHILQNQELNVDANSHITLRDDSPDSIGHLGLLALEITQSFASMNNPNSLETKILTPIQIQSFTDPTNGVLPQFNLLVTGVILEGLTRIENGQGSAELVNSLRSIGTQIGNTKLQNLK